MPEMASEELLGCVHTEEYLNNFINGKTSEQEQRRTGFPWSEGIVRRCRYETGEEDLKSPADFTAERVIHTVSLSDRWDCTSC